VIRQNASAAPRPAGSIPVSLTAIRSQRQIRMLSRCLDRAVTRQPVHTLAFGPESRRGQLAGTGRAGTRHPEARPT